MNFENSTDFERLRQLLVQFEIEGGVLDRMVYKNKNQHRRGSYFQYLLKVRRDVRLLQSARLREVLKVLFSIMDGKKPAQQALYATRSKSSSRGANNNMMDRLLGIARLLSQMTEPILKAATFVQVLVLVKNMQQEPYFFPEISQITLLLAKSFFTGFCITVLALLARLRVLVQQILHDVVLIYNKVSSLTLEKQSVKLSQDGIEAFREYYPLTGKIVVLDCVWKEDKFLLFERTENKNIENKDEDLAAVPSTSIQYETLEVFGKALGHESICTSSTEATVRLSEDETEPLPSPGNGRPTNIGEASEETFAVNRDVVPRSTHVEPHNESKRKVAFVSVKRPSPTNSNTSVPNKKIKLDLVSSNSVETEDPFMSLLFSGTSNSSTFRDKK